MHKPNGLCPYKKRRQTHREDVPVRRRWRLQPRNVTHANSHWGQSEVGRVVPAGPGRSMSCWA